MVKIAILIPTISSRKEKLNSLLSAIRNQIAFNEVMGVEFDILIHDAENLTTGYKRNVLIGIATAKGCDYVEFVDDDDMISDNHIENISHAALSGKDCASLKGIYTVDGTNPVLFEHSIKYKKYAENTDAKPDEIRYERYPNHLNLIKTDIANKVKFPDITFGEDYKWATELNELGLIKTEFEINDVIYHYQYTTKK